MYTNNMLAVSGALFSLAAAVPMAKRDIVWVTETAVDVVTMPVTTTVWVDAPGQTSSVAAVEVSYSHFGHGHHSHSPVTSTVTLSASSSSSVAPVETSSSVYVPPTTSSTSTYVAPTTSSSSVYVAPTTSSTSIYVAPTTSSTSIYVAPTTSSTSVYVAPTTSSISVAPTTTASPTTYAASSVASSVAATATGVVSSGPGAAGTSYTGDLTWYQDGLGACGLTNGPDDAIVAISHIIFDSYPDGGNPNDNPMCGQTVSITGADGSTYEAIVVDRCTGCNEGDLDLSEDYFNAVTNYGNGRVPGMTWHFN